MYLTRQTSFEILFWQSPAKVYSQGSYDSIAMSGNQGSHRMHIISSLDYSSNACLFVVFRSTRKYFTHMKTSPWLVKDCKFWPMFALVVIAQWGFNYQFVMVIFEIPWHLSPSVWQGSCHYLILRLRSVVAGIRKPNLPLARQTI